MSWPRPADRPVDRERVRRRVLAFAGLWFLTTGMLAAAGFFVPFLASLALLLLGGLVAGGVWLFRRHQLGQVARTALTSLGRASKKSEARIDELELGRHVKHAASLASDRARALLDVRPREPEPVDPRGHALHLNERGAQLRRRGDYEQAAEQHRAALAIARELEDRSMEALTLNNLALAVVHTESVRTAVQHFEEALVILRELGDEEHEGQVIANLGFIRHRQGRDEDAASLLSEALDKLPPESAAYRHVEKQLRRAS